METIETDKIYHSTIADIERHALKPAFDKIRLLLQNNENWDLHQKIDETEQNYRYLLSYLVGGTKDSERNKIYRSIVATAFGLADDALLLVQTKYSPALYYEKLRTTQRSVGPTIEEIIRQLLSATEKPEEERYASELFGACWLCKRIQPEEWNLLASFLHNPEAEIHHKQLLLSALMLGCLCRFDEAKITLLLEACFDETQQIRQRSLVSALLLIHRYEKRIQYYATVMRTLKQLCEMPWFKANARSITMQFILARQTEKINQDLNKKFMEHIDEIKPFIESQMKGGHLSVDPEELSDEKNPEWGKGIENKKIAKLMEEVMDMQTEGADLMAHTFARLKNFPFFNDMSNWFLPYYSQHSSITALRDGGEDILKIAPFVCDSDKYSLMFASNSFGANIFDTIREQIEANQEAVDEQMEEMKFLHDPAKQTSLTATLYIHNLYRFFKNHPRHLDFYDPFHLPLDLYSVEPLKAYLADTESLALFSEYYIQKDLCKEAIPLLSTLIKQDASQSECFQKLGFCYQMTEQFNLALDAYRKADLIHPDHTWTLKKIAACYRKLGLPDKALAVYRNLEAIQPQNYSTLLNMGHLLLEMNRPEEALTCYFKIEFNDKKGDRVQRPIAWASFMAGKYEQAERYYNRLLSGTPTASDLVNAGHTQIALGNIHSGIEHYIKSREASSLDEFLKQYAADMPDLVNAGIEEMLLNALPNQLIYMKLKN